MLVRVEAHPLGKRLHVGRRRYPWGVTQIGPATLRTPRARTPGGSRMPDETVQVRGHARHGQQSLTYNSWRGMCHRCRSPNAAKYRYYGGRGIRVCAGWQQFARFLADLGERPAREYSIDRIDTNGHYSCGRCNECVANGWPANGRWSTQSEQCRNRRPRAAPGVGDMSRAMAIRIACATTTLTRHAVAEMYAVHVETVRSIALGKTWRCLP